MVKSWKKGGKCGEKLQKVGENGEGGKSGEKLEKSREKLTSG